MGRGVVGSLRRVIAVMALLLLSAAHLICASLVVSTALLVHAALLGNASALPLTRGSANAFRQHIRGQAVKPPSHPS